MTTETEALQFVLKFATEWNNLGIVNMINLNYRPRFQQKFYKGLLIVTTNVNTNDFTLSRIYIVALKGLKFATGVINLNIVNLIQSFYRHNNSDFLTWIYKGLFVVTTNVNKDDLALPKRYIVA